MSPPLVALFPRAVFALLASLGAAPAVQVFSVLTYNVDGNDATDLSTNSAQVQAIGRQLSHLQPDVITFNEIPFLTSWEMTNFVKAFLPGHLLAMNSGTDGYLRSAILSRHLIVRSKSWLDGVTLTNFGYNGSFTRDLFEAELSVPGFEQPLHIFTTHLKAGTATNDLARRGAEASAISNFLVTVFLPTNSARPYVLTGDLNEDIGRPRSGSQHPIERLLSAPTGLRLTTPLNPFSNDDRTLSIRSSLFVRYDYVLPCGLLYSNVASSQVFRTDLLNPRPSNVLSNDSRTASDHLPVLMVFNNPYPPFRLTSVTASNGMVHLTWPTSPGRQYCVEASSNLTSWAVMATNLAAASAHLSWTTNASRARQFFRVGRMP
jgi:endonuclease/exonuclease/phosphatase family metal-dependent hydrolase